MPSKSMSLTNPSGLHADLDEVADRVVAILSGSQKPVATSRCVVVARDLAPSSPPRTTSRRGSGSAARQRPSPAPPPSPTWGSTICP